MDEQSGETEEEENNDRRGEPEAQELQYQITG